MIHSAEREWHYKLPAYTGSLAECERLGLGKDVRQKHVVMATKRVQRV